MGEEGGELGLELRSCHDFVDEISEEADFEEFPFPFGEAVRLALCLVLLDDALAVHCRPALAALGPLLRPALFLVVARLVDLLRLRLSRLGERALLALLFFVGRGRVLSGLFEEGLVDGALFGGVFGGVGGGLLLVPLLGLSWGLVIGNLDDCGAAVSLRIFLIFILKILPPHSSLQLLRLALGRRGGEVGVADLGGE